MGCPLLEAVRRVAPHLEWEWVDYYWGPALIGRGEAVRVDVSAERSGDGWRITASATQRLPNGFEVRWSSDLPRHTVTLFGRVLEEVLLHSNARWEVEDER